MQQLQDVMDAYAKKLTINIDVNEIAETRIKEIKDILDNHIGEGKLHFQIFDPKSKKEEQLYVKMPSRTQRVRISQELLERLEESRVHYLSLIHI